MPSEPKDVWELRKADADSDRLGEFLCDGWEPFAVTVEQRESTKRGRALQEWTQDVYHLRRRREVFDAE
ncbi:MAG: hypothetical protein Q8R92_07205 [Deltaproteobacteria bacterium]|nr:hypothetical protein [Deltaproteobacteria bacterium]